MPGHMNESRHFLLFHLRYDQGNYGKIKSPGGGIEMDDQRGFSAREFECDFVFGQITLNSFKLFHGGTLKKIE
jgi:hypothetical protein